VGEIIGLKFDADWIVLSACNTAAGQGAGAEALSGLGRAFFHAGARSLLATNWSVETVSARQMTTNLFKRHASNPSLSRAEALRQTMLELLDGPGAVENGKTLYSYAHPIFWAPFTLFGGPFAVRCRCIEAAIEHVGRDGARLPLAQIGRAAKPARTHPKSLTPNTLVLVFGRCQRQDRGVARVLQREPSSHVSRRTDATRICLVGRG
jgi:hypothetical protein